MNVVVVTRCRDSNRLWTFKRYSTSFDEAVLSLILFWTKVLCLFHIFPADHLELLRFSDLKQQLRLAQCSLTKIKTKTPVYIKIRIRTPEN